VVIKNIADMERVVREIDAERDAKNGAPTKSCFVISPIGEDGSETRKRADQILKFVIHPAVREFGYAAVRADSMPEPGLITSQVIDRIMNADLVVADLTGRNPNVFYELAIRHAIRKPFVQIIASGESLPFDVFGMRTISVDHHDLDSVARGVEDIKNQIATLEKTPDAIQTPISVTLDVSTLRRSERPEERLLADIMNTVSEINARVAELQTADARSSATQRSRRTPDPRRYPLPAGGDTFGLVEVVGEEGNRRDAVLRCGYCGQGPIEMHFYEGDGEPKFPEVLGLFHYWECEGIASHGLVRVLLTGHGRQPTFLLWSKPPRREDDPVPVDPDIS